MKKDTSGFTDKYTAKSMKSKKASIKWVSGWFTVVAVIGGVGVIATLISGVTGDEAPVAAIVVSALVMLFAIRSRKKIVDDPAGSRGMLIAWIVWILIIAAVNAILMPGGRPPSWSILFAGAFAYALHQHVQIYGKKR